ncbi:hypothetical protein ACMEER_001515, partial [Campylobacter jejuni]
KWHFKTYFLCINDDGCGFPSNDEEFGMVLSEFMVSNKTKARYGKKGKGRYAFALATNSPFDDGAVIYTKRNNEITKISFKTDVNGNIEFNCSESNEKFENNITTSVIIKDLNFKHFHFDNIKNDDIKEQLTVIKSDIIAYFADIIASNSVNIYK